MSKAATLSPEVLTELDRVSREGGPADPGRRMTLDEFREADTDKIYP